MVALQMDGLKEFTRQLFIGETFDAFLLREAKIVTYNSFQIDGTVRPGFYSQEEAEALKLEEYSAWGVLRPFVFSLIRGKRLPESFHIVLQLSGEQKKRFLEASGLAFSAEEVNGLYLNIRYEEKALLCVTGTSVSRFTLDKSLEHSWDQEVKDFLKAKGLPFEEA